MKRRSLLFSVIFLGACACLPAQAPAQQELPPAPPTADSLLKTQVRIVALDALVHDRKGELVHGLNKDAFTLAVDTKPQPIRYFSEDNDLPLTIGLMVDTSGSQRQYFAEQRIASATFLRSMLTRKGDNAFAVRFDTNVLLLQRMTTNLPELQSALNRLEYIYPARSGPGGGTLLFDAICGTSHLAFMAERRRRAVVILTDGEDNGSTKTRDQATECAQRDEVTVYTALYTSRDQYDDERSDPHVHVSARDHLPGRVNMERISRATGGRVFVVSKRLPIELIYKQIEEDLRNQYRFGFTPPPSAPATYHELLLKAVDKHSKVQTRLGYYTPANP